MITFHDIWHHYGARPTLRGVDLTVRAGELVCVMGPNGMGKTTLLSVAAGLLPPLRGRVEIDGLVRRSSIEAERAIRRRVVYLPDSPWLARFMTGREMLVAVGRLYEIEPVRLFEHIDLLLDVFDLGTQGDQIINNYSTGQRKKIGLCSALVTEAPILILDEPLSGGLDASGLLAVRTILRKLAERRDVTVLMAVPVPELVDQVADRIAVIDHGQIIADGTPDALCRQADRPTLAEALERLTHPDRPDHLTRYLDHAR